MAATLYREAIGHHSDGIAVRRTQVKWPWQIESGSKKHLLGIEMGPGGVAFAQISYVGPGRYRLNRCEYIEEFEELKQQVHCLEWVAKNNCKGMSCNVSLHPNNYQLLLVEAPDVAAEEVQSAMKWRVKDLIDFPIDDAVMDAFSLPEDAYRGQMRMMYAAVAYKETAQRIVSIVNKCGLNLASIDIRELVIRNLLVKPSTLDEPSQEGVGLITLRKANSLISLVSANQLYLSRRVQLPVDHLEGNAYDTERLLDDLVVEIHRSIDYYENQLGKGMIHKLVFAPTVVPLTNTLKYLAEQVNSKISILDLEESLEFAEPFEKEVQAQCLGAIGAAMRIML